MHSILRILILTLCLIGAVESRADGEIRVNGKVTDVVESEDAEKYPCGKQDPDCATAMLRIITGFGPRLQLKLGAVPCPDGGIGAAASLKASGIQLDLPSGDAEAGILEAALAPGGLRLRFTLGKSTVSFFCNDENGETRAPVTGVFAGYCKPDEKFGMAGSLAELQWDESRGRFAGRWAMFNGVLALLGNGQGTDYLKKRLNLLMGGSVESVWNAEGHDGTQHRLRGLAGIQGLVRTDDSRWEARTEILYRPAVQDFGLEASAGLNWNFPVGRDWVGSTGIDLRLTHWSDPAVSIGPNTPIDSKTAVQTGLVLEFKYDYRGDQ